MTILAITDIHGAYAKAASIIAAHPADVVIIGGDLTNAGAPGEAEDALRQLRSAAGSAHLLAVAGNMDLRSHETLHQRMGISLHGRGVVVDDVGFFGVSGGPLSPLHTPYELSEEEIAQTLDAGYAMAAQAKVHVAVPHAPPHGTAVDIIRSGAHVGSASVRAFIEQRCPALVICGHIHEARGQDTLGSTRIVNCGHGRSGQFALIGISSSGAVTIEMKDA